MLQVPMISPLNKSTGAKSLLSFETIVLAAIAWGVLALLFYLLFSVPIEGAEGVLRRANWYVVGTYVFDFVFCGGLFVPRLGYDFSGKLQPTQSRALAVGWGGGNRVAWHNAGYLDFYTNSESKDACSFRFPVGSGPGRVG